MTQIQEIKLKIKKLRSKKKKSTKKKTLELPNHPRGVNRSPLKLLRDSQATPKHFGVVRLSHKFRGVVDPPLRVLFDSTLFLNNDNNNNDNNFLVLVLLLLLCFFLFVFFFFEFIGVLLFY